MTINFDILISGCNTRCKHCYVNGGPSGLMSVENALLIFEKLDLLAELLPYETSFTLDNEPMNHPAIETIIRGATATKHIECYHHGMTTGIALMNRNDRLSVMQAYLECGYRDFGITIHGSALHHDEIVSRPGAYQIAIEAAEYMRSCGAEIGVSLMFNRFFSEDAEEIDSMLMSLKPDYIYFAIPNFTPHEHMTDFEPYRGSVDMLHQLSPWFVRWKQQEDRLLEDACTVEMLKEQLRHGLDITELFRCPQDEMYLTIHQNGDLFVGNTGVETNYLGNMLSLDIKETAAHICELPGNSDYGAFYEVNRLPDSLSLIRALEQLPKELLYNDRASAIYRGLSILEIPTKICCYNSN